MGFYWDDFPISWIAATMGGEGLERYFSTNRPVWGLIYRVTTPLLGSSPLTWQIFGLLMRWATGLALWVLLRQVWPERDAALQPGQPALFVLYPGFSQQYIAFMYSHFYIVLTCLLLSLLLMVLAQRQPALVLAADGLALGCCRLVNLLSMEYFFLLDLLRPVLLWIVLEREPFPTGAGGCAGPSGLAALPGYFYRRRCSGARSCLASILTSRPWSASCKVQPVASPAGTACGRPAGYMEDRRRRLGKSFTFPTAAELGERKPAALLVGYDRRGCCHASGYLAALPACRIEPKSRTWRSRRGPGSRQRWACWPYSSPVALSG